jgi:hypothetical protein
MAKAFEGKVVLITGANSGIGEAIAVAFREAGATVFGIARRSDALETSRARHPDIRWLRADVADSKEVNAAVASAVSEAGRLDVVVNNAGIFRFAPLEQSSEELVRRQFEANVYVHDFRGAGGAAGAAREPRKHREHQQRRRAQAHSGRRALRRDQSGRGVADALVGPRIGAVRHPSQRDRAGARRHAGFDKSDIPPAALPAVKESFAKQVPLGRMGSSEEVALGGGDRRSEHDLGNGPGPVDRRRNEPDLSS